MDKLVAHAYPNTLGQHPIAVQSAPVARIVHRIALASTKSALTLARELVDRTRGATSSTEAQFALVKRNSRAILSSDVHP